MLWIIVIILPALICCCSGTDAEISFEKVHKIFNEEEKLELNKIKGS